jgi:hypothetical protein
MHRGKFVAGGNMANGPLVGTPKEVTVGAIVDRIIAKGPLVSPKGVTVGAIVHRIPSSRPTLY